MRLLRDTVGGLPRTFWAIFAALLVNRIGAFGMLLLPTYLATVRGTSLALAGWVTGAYGAGGGVGTLLGGVLADRWGEGSRTSPALSPPRSSCSLSPSPRPSG